MPPKLAAYRKALDAAIAAFPADVELLLQRGIAESPDPADRGQGRWPASIPLLRAGAEGARPDHFAAQHYLAHAYENTGRMKEALAHAAAYATQAPDVPHARAHARPRAAARRARSTRRSRDSRRPTSCSAPTSRARRSRAEFDWHHQHNLDLLATSYQYLGQMRKAEALLKQSFGCRRTCSCRW